MQLIDHDLGFAESHAEMKPVMRRVLAAHLSRLLARGGGVPPSMTSQAASVSGGEVKDDLVQNSSVYYEDPQELSSFNSESSDETDPVIQIEDFIEVLQILSRGCGQQRDISPEKSPPSEVRRAQRSAYNVQREILISSIVHRIGGGYFCAQREILLPSGYRPRNEEPAWPVDCEGSFDVDDLDVSFVPESPSALKKGTSNKVILGAWQTVGYPAFRKPLALIDSNRRPDGRSQKSRNCYTEKEKQNKRAREQPGHWAGGRGTGSYGFGGGFGRSQTSARPGYPYKSACRGSATADHGACPASTPPAMPTVEPQFAPPQRDAPRYSPAPEEVDEENFMEAGEDKSSEAVFGAESATRDVQFTTTAGIPISVIEEEEEEEE